MNGPLKAKEAYEAFDAIMEYAAVPQQDGPEFLGEELLIDAVQRVRDAFVADPEYALKTIDRWLREQAAGIRESDTEGTKS